MYRIAQAQWLRVVVILSSLIGGQQKTTCSQLQTDRREKELTTSHFGDVCVVFKETVLKLVRIRKQENSKQVSCL